MLWEFTMIIKASVEQAMEKAAKREKSLQKEKQNV